MRAGIDIRLPNPESGQQRMLWRLGTWLGAQGHETHFVTMRPMPDDVDLPPGTHLHRLADRSGSAFRRAVLDLELDALLINPERARRYRGIPANVLRAAYGTEHYAQNLRSFRNPWERGVRTAVVLTGGNVDSDQFRRVLAGATPSP